jgi:hypothetical protein
VEDWLALPQPQMPAFAFANQFGEHPVPTLANCENNEGITGGEPKSCRKWWTAQTERRKQLVRPFTVQYGLMSGSLVRAGNPRVFPRNCQAGRCGWGCRRGSLPWKPRWPGAGPIHP